MMNNLNFIINYDIKYRMGDKLNDGENSKGGETNELDTRAFWLV